MEGDPGGGSSGPRPPRRGRPKQPPRKSGDAACDDRMDISVVMTRVDEADAMQTSFGGSQSPSQISGELDCFQAQGWPVSPLAHARQKSGGVGHFNQSTDELGGFLRPRSPAHPTQPRSPHIERIDSGFASADGSGMLVPSRMGPGGGGLKRPRQVRPGAPLSHPPQQQQLQPAGATTNASFQSLCHRTTTMSEDVPSSAQEINPANPDSAGGSVGAGRGGDRSGLSLAQQLDLSGGPSGEYSAAHSPIHAGTGVGVGVSTGTGSASVMGSALGTPPLAPARAPGGFGEIATAQSSPHRTAGANTAARDSATEGNAFASQLLAPVRVKARSLRSGGARGDASGDLVVAVGHAPMATPTAADGGSASGDAPPAHASRGILDVLTRVYRFTLRDALSLVGQTGHPDEDEWELVYVMDAGEVTPSDSPMVSPSPEVHSTSGITPRTSPSVSPRLHSRAPGPALHVDNDRLLFVILAPDETDAAIGGCGGDFLFKKTPLYGGGGSWGGSGMYSGGSLGAADLSNASLGSPSTPPRSPLSRRRWTSTDLAHAREMPPGVYVYRCNTPGAEGSVHCPGDCIVFGDDDLFINLKKRAVSSQLVQFGDVSQGRSLLASGSTSWEKVRTLHVFVAPHASSQPPSPQHEPPQKIPLLSSKSAGALPASTAGLRRDAQRRTPPFTIDARANEEDALRSEDEDLVQQSANDPGQGAAGAGALGPVPHRRRTRDSTLDDAAMTAAVRAREEPYSRVTSARPIAPTRTSGSPSDPAQMQAQPPAGGEAPAATPHPPLPGPAQAHGQHEEARDVEERATQGWPANSRSPQKYSQYPSTGSAATPPAAVAAVPAPAAAAAAGSGSSTVDGGAHALLVLAGIACAESVRAAFIATLKELRRAKKDEKRRRREEKLRRASQVSEGSDAREQPPQDHHGAPREASPHPSGPAGAHGGATAHRPPSGPNASNGNPHTHGHNDMDLTFYLSSSSRRSPPPRGPHGGYAAVAPPAAVAAAKPSPVVVHTQAQPEPEPRASPAEAAEEQDQGHDDAHDEDRTVEQQRVPRAASFTEEGAPCDRATPDRHASAAQMPAHARAPSPSDAPAAADASRGAPSHERGRVSPGARTHARSAEAPGRVVSSPAVRTPARRGGSRDATRRPTPAAVAVDTSSGRRRSPRVSPQPAARRVGAPTGGGTAGMGTAATVVHPGRSRSAGVSDRRVASARAGSAGATTRRPLVAAHARGGGPAHAHTRPSTARAPPDQQAGEFQDDAPATATGAPPVRRQGSWLRRLAEREARVKEANKTVAPRKPSVPAVARGTPEGTKARGTHGGVSPLRRAKSRSAHGSGPTAAGGHTPDADEEKRLQRAASREKQWDRSTDVPRLPQVPGGEDDGEESTTPPTHHQHPRTRPRSAASDTHTVVPRARSGGSAQHAHPTGRGRGTSRDVEHTDARGYGRQDTQKSGTASAAGAPSPSRSPSPPCCAPRLSNQQSSYTGRSRSHSHGHATATYERSHTRETERSSARVPQAQPLRHAPWRVPGTNTSSTPPTSITNTRGGRAHTQAHARAGHAPPAETDRFRRCHTTETEATHVPDPNAYDLGNGYYMRPPPKSSRGSDGSPLRSHSGPAAGSRAGSRQQAHVMSPARSERYGSRSGGGAYTLTLTAPSRSPERGGRAPATAGVSPGSRRFVRTVSAPAAGGRSVGVSSSSVHPSPATRSPSSSASPMRRRSGGSIRYSSASPPRHRDYDAATDWFQTTTSTVVPGDPAARRGSSSNYHQHFLNPHAGGGDAASSRYSSPARDRSRSRSRSPMGRTTLGVPRHHDYEVSPRRRESWGSYVCSHGADAASRHSSARRSRSASQVSQEGRSTAGERATTRSDVNKTQQPRHHRSADPEVHEAAEEEGEKAAQGNGATPPRQQRDGAEENEEEPGGTEAPRAERTTAEGAGNAVDITEVQPTAPAGARSDVAPGHAAAGEKAGDVDADAPAAGTSVDDGAYTRADSIDAGTERGSTPAAAAVENKGATGHDHTAQREQAADDGDAEEVDATAAAAGGSEGAGAEEAEAGKRLHDGRRSTSASPTSQVCEEFHTSRRIAAMRGERRSARRERGRGDPHGYPHAHTHAEYHQHMHRAPTQTSDRDGYGYHHHYHASPRRRDDVVTAAAAERDWQASLRRSRSPGSASASVSQSPSRSPASGHRQAGHWREHLLLPKYYQCPVTGMTYRGAAHAETRRELANAAMLDVGVPAELLFYNEFMDGRHDVGGRGTGMTAEACADRWLAKALEHAHREGGAGRRDAVQEAWRACLESPLMWEAQEIAPVGASPADTDAAVFAEYFAKQHPAMQQDGTVLRAHRGCEAGCIRVVSPPRARQHAATATPDIYTYNPGECI